MSPARRGARHVPMSAILFWAGFALLLGLSLGFLLSQQGCGPSHSSKSREQHEKSAPKPIPRPSTKIEAKPSPKANPRESEPRHPLGEEPFLQPSPGIEKPRLALVIDDLGYGAPELVTRLCAQPVPFSLAVLPYLEYSKESAEIAHETGKEVLLHLPMEPMGYPGPHKDPGPGAVFYDLPEKEIRTRVRKALHEISHCKGVNNHMGSRITPDRRRMVWILQEIKAFRCYFLDSRTEKDSVASELAVELKIPTVQRNVFLDDDKSLAEMEKQWERALDIAHKEGQVVVIAHMYPETVEALEKLISKTKDRITFVKASELAK